MFCMICMRCEIGYHLAAVAVDYRKIPINFLWSSFASNNATDSHPPPKKMASATKNYRTLPTYSI